MNVYIVRDAVEIGHFPRADIEGLAQGGQLLPSDFYWHEGMEGWLPLPDLLGADAWQLNPSATAEDETSAAFSAPMEVSPPGSESHAAGPSTFAQIKDWIAGAPRPVIISAICAVLIFLAVVAVCLTRSNRAEKNSATVSAVSPIQHPATSDLALKKKAFEQLKRKIDMLPITPVPPWNATYYDFSVNMIPSGSPSFPWTATIHGGENIIDPDTQATVRRTDFVLTVEYRNGEWSYRDYRAVETDAANGATREIFDDEKTPVPPNIVGILGLKRNL